VNADAQAGTSPDYGFINMPRTVLYRMRQEDNEKKNHYFKRGTGVLDRKGGRETRNEEEKGTLTKNP